MKIIYPDCIYSLSANSFDAEYPVANLLDDHPSKVWKAVAGVTTAILTIVTTGAVAGIHIAGTNAISGTVYVKNSTETVTHETHTLAGTFGQFFVKFDAVYASTLHIIVSLTSGTTVYAGICRAGTLLSFPNPQYGLTQKRHDYSIKKELSNGGLYIYNRHTPRQYDLSFLMTYSEYNTIDALFIANGSIPLAFLIADEIDSDDQWSGFFHIVDPPSAGYEYHSHLKCSFTLQEAV
ncbi:MAG: hypothetical protein WCR46_05060 [Deltaproteobacteria bacterium]